MAQIAEIIGIVPSCINNAGQIAGTINNSSTQTSSVGLWQNGVVTNLGNLPGNSVAFSAAINDSGEIVGWSAASASTAFDSQAFLWQNGVMTNLGTVPGYSYNRPIGINDAGQILLDPTKWDPSINNWVNGQNYIEKSDSNTFVSESGIFSTVLTYGINASGQVPVIIDGPVGATSYSQIYTYGHAGIWRGGNITDLGTLSGDNSSAAAAINNAGDVVGESRHFSVVNGISTIVSEQAVLWKNGSIISLGSLPGDGFSEATGINSSDQVIGMAWANANGGVEVPFFWQNGSMVNVNSLLPAGSGWVINTVTAINDSGEIIGQGTLNGVNTSFLLNLGATGSAITNTTGQQTTLTAPAPNTPVQGGGYDILNLSQNPLATASSAYTMTANGDGSLTLATTGSSEHVSGVLQVEFSDKTVTIAGAKTFNEDVALLYQGALGRSPDAGGLKSWDVIANALPASEQSTGVYALSDDSGNYNNTLSVAAGFTNSAEFEAKYGSLTNAQFVTQLYSNILDRAPDTAGYNSWMAALNSGASREHVLVGFADSAEAITNATNGFVGQSGTHAAWLFLT